MATKKTVKKTTTKKPAKAKVKTENSPIIASGAFTIEKVNELNFFDITGEKAKTKGTSNKFYHAELQLSKSGSDCQIFTMYGATGRVQKQEWRGFSNITDAEKEFERIIKSKIKKGYQQIDVANRVLGSEEAKKITKAVKLKNAPLPVKSNNLHPETNRVISRLMGATNKWVADTLKCPLGQLSNEQIDKGRACLDEARKIIGAKHKKEDLIDQTNLFYGLIPHNLGAGSRGTLDNLILDSKDKIDQKEYDLDTLLDAKAIGNSLVSDSTYDQYKSLDTDFKYIENNSSLFKWIDSMIQSTRASNHRHLGKIKLITAWDVQRKQEREIFTKEITKIASECGKQVYPDQLDKLMKSREDVWDKDLFSKANVTPLFHGTRTQNLTGILKKGLLIRPSGVVITGAMYGNGIYFSSRSSKSIAYSSIRNSYWSGGNDDRAFLFVSDCALGKQKIATRSYQYNLKNISPYHSVWAKGGQSGVINDEMMLYTTKQHNLRYLLEFSCN